MGPSTKEQPLPTIGVSLACWLCSNECYWGSTRTKSFGQYADGAYLRFLPREALARVRLEVHYSRWGRVEPDMVLVLYEPDAFVTDK